MLLDFLLSIIVDIILYERESYRAKLNLKKLLTNYKQKGIVYWTLDGFTFSMLVFDI
jgi:hypothetical protein